MTIALSSAVRGASPEKIGADHATTMLPPSRQTRANSHDPNEHCAKMGSSMRIAPLSLPPRPVLYNVIASMTLTHAPGKPVI